MNFIRTYAPRLYAVAAAVVALVLVYVPGLPDAAILAVVAAGLGLGETVQRADDSKTVDALFTPVPGENAERGFEDPTGLYL